MSPVMDGDVCIMYTGTGTKDGPFFYSIRTSHFGCPVRCGYRDEEDWWDSKGEFGVDGLEFISNGFE